MDDLTDQYINQYTEIKLTDEQAREAIQYWFNQKYLKESVFVETLDRHYETGQITLKVIPLAEVNDDGLAAISDHVINPPSDYPEEVND